MEFNNKLYQLRKQKGLSQEELANRLNVSRQTVSKWEIGDSTPDMEKLAAISSLFDISLDELVMGKEPDTEPDVKSGVKSGVENSIEKTADSKSTLENVLNEKILTSDNKKKAKRGLKFIGIGIGVIFLIDIISMIIYFSLYGIPQ